MMIIVTKLFKTIYAVVFVNGWYHIIQLQFLKLFCPKYSIVYIIWRQIVVDRPVILVTLAKLIRFYFQPFQIKLSKANSFHWKNNHPLLIMFIIRIRKLQWPKFSFSIKLFVVMSAKNLFQVLLRLLYIHLLFFCSCSSIL